MAIEPLRWPEYLRNANFMQQLFGAQGAAHRELKRQVEARDEAECQALWKQDARTIEVRDRILDIIRDTVGWKSRNFIPADPYGLLLYSSDGMEFIAAKRRMEKQFGIKVGMDVFRRMLEGMPVGELVDMIAEDRRDDLAAESPQEPVKKNRFLSVLGCVGLAIVGLLFALGLFLLVYWRICAWRS